MPKAKADQVVIHRIEFQEHERELLDMLAMSVTANNVTESVGNLLKPFTQCTLAGASMAMAFLGAAAIAVEAEKHGIEQEDIPPFFFGIIPGVLVYGIRHIDPNVVASEFDRLVKAWKPAGPIM